MRAECNRQERRCCDRREVFGKPLAVMRPGPGSSGRVERISPAAVEVVYSATNGSNAAETDELDILVADFTRGFCLQAIPVKTLSDRSTEPCDCSLSLNFRRRILVFSGLNRNQQLDLQRFMQTYAM